MRKIAIVLALGLSLGGCASLQTAWSVVTGVSVSPTQIIVAANAFDAGEASATQYRNYCIANPAVSYCALKIQQKVKAAVLAGRPVRNQLEPYIVSGTAGPAALYNSLVTLATQLQASIPSTGASQ